MNKQATEATLPGPSLPKAFPEHTEKKAALGPFKITLKIFLKIKRDLKDTAKGILPSNAIRRQELSSREPSLLFQQLYAEWAQPHQRCG